jgi:hypothetical protein
MRTLNRITLIGALFLGTVAILPFIAATLTGVNLSCWELPRFSSWWAWQLTPCGRLEAQLVMRNYEGIYQVGEVMLHPASTPSPSLNKRKVSGFQCM